MVKVQTLSFKVLFLCYLFFDLDKVYLVDILYNHCIVILSKLVHLGNKSFV